MFIAVDFTGAGDVRAKLLFSLCLTVTFLSFEIYLCTEASGFDCYSL